MFIRLLIKNLMNMEHQMMSISNTTFTKDVIKLFMTQIDFEEDESPLLGEITRLSSLSIHDTRYMYPFSPTVNLLRIYSIEGYDDVTNYKPSSEILPKHQKKLIELCGFCAKMLKYFNWPVKASLIHSELMVAYWNLLHKDTEFNVMWVDQPMEIQCLFEHYINTVIRASMLVRNRN
jgi:hypothetical protein